MKKILLIAFFCFGCKHIMSSADADSGIERIRYLELRVLAEEELNCDRDRIDYEYLGDKVHLLTGCGREVRYLVFPYNDVWVKTKSFHERASFELDCAIDKLKSEHIEEGKWRVTGCGGQVTYVLECENASEQCKWKRLSQNDYGESTNSNVTAIPQAKAN